MAYPIPTTEPAELRAGDTWQWRREDLADYPASAGWVLSYVFINAAAKISLTASADVDAFAVTVAASTTTSYAAGRYDWIARVTLSGVVHTVDTGTLQVLPSLATSTLDNRTHARKVLEAIEAVLEGRASLDQESYEILGRSLKRTPLRDLLLLRDRYRVEARREDDARAGVDSRRYLVRFGAPS